MTIGLVPDCVLNVSASRGTQYVALNWWKPVLRKPLAPIVDVVPKNAGHCFFTSNTLRMATSSSGSKGALSYEAVMCAVSVL